MAKNNNKGFSLIEVIVAIAILTLLLTPIMRQFSLTLETNRKAKEQQYSNENAEYMMEYFQKTDVDKVSTDVNDELYSTTAAPTVETITCDILVGGTVVDQVDYNAITYTMNDVQLGAKNTNYTRTAVLDDLSTKLLAMDEANNVGYRIVYNQTQAELSNYSGFSLTDEGSIVRYEDGYVKAVVCSETNYAGDPNMANLGNMQNLDSTTVAMINGIASNFDAQSEKTFYSMKMENLKSVDYDSWKQAMEHNQGDNIFSSADFVDTVHKVTKITVTQDTDTNGDFYLVKADIYYDDSYSINGTAFTDKLSYNVFSQKFRTDRCPDIYFEYQPYVENIDGSNVQYGAEDYILLDTLVEDVKIYLYKPSEDAYYKYQELYGLTTISYPREEYNGVMTPMYARNTGYSVRPVKIRICKASDEVKDPYIYTNLLPTTAPSANNVQQFYTSAYTVVPDAVGLLNTIGSPDLRKEYDASRLKGLTDDTRYDNRLYTVTVRLVPDNSASNTVVLTGAKGD